MNVPPARSGLRPSPGQWRPVIVGHASTGYVRWTPDERGLLSNARCLGEGIDVPTLDGIAFIDPKHSQVDIVQAVGRAIRKGDGTKTATIVRSGVRGHDRG